LACGILRKQLAQQLQPTDQLLSQLDDNFRDLQLNPNENQNQLVIIGTEALENHFIIHRRYLPDKTFVVAKSSGSRYFFGTPNYMGGTDHFSIVKPSGLGDRSHNFLFAFYDRYRSIAKKREEGAKEYRDTCLISLSGAMPGADKFQDFVGVGGNYPTPGTPNNGLWTVNCAKFRPNAAVSAVVHIDFDQSSGGTGVLVRPILIQDGSLGPDGQAMQYFGSGPSGFLSSTISGRSSSDGTVTIGIYVGIPAMAKQFWNLSARPGSFIKITQP
jgi:hypothetical protein